MSSRGWGVRVIVASAIAVLVTGCMGDPDPVVLPTLTVDPPVLELPTPEPTPSPSPTELTEEEVLAAIPAAARHEGFYGAQEFVRFFLVQSQEMVRRQNGQVFEAMSDPDCVFCQTSLDVLRRHQEENLVVEGGELVVLGELAKGACETETMCHVEFDVDIAPTKWIDPDDVVVADSPAESLRAAVKTEYVDGFWIVTGVGSEERAD